MTFKPINERRETKRFCLNATHIEHMAAILEHFSHVHVTQIASENPEEFRYVVRTIGYEGPQQDVVIQDHLVRAMVGCGVQVLETVTVLRSPYSSDGNCALINLKETRKGLPS